MLLWGHVRRNWFRCVSGACPVCPESDYEPSKAVARLVQTAQDRAPKARTAWMGVGENWIRAGAILSSIDFNEDGYSFRGR
jgi:hypothetical protein